MQTQDYTFFVAAQSVTSMEIFNMSAASFSIHLWDLHLNVKQSFVSLKNDLKRVSL